MREVEGTRFEDAFTGEERYGYHLSVDSMKIIRDDTAEIFDKTVETDKYAYFKNDYDDCLMFAKDDEGELGHLVSNNYFASVGLFDSLEQIWTRGDEEKLVWMDKETRDYLPEIAKENEWQSGRHNASKITFTEVEFLGAAALFTESRISRNTVPKPLCAYDVRHADDDWTEPVQVAKGVLVNHMGTLVTHAPITFPNDEPLEVDGQTLDFYSGQRKTLAEFAAEHNIKLKQPKDRQR